MGVCLENLDCSGNGFRRQGVGGLGWYINSNRNQLLIPSVFAGLLTIIVFGLLVENLFFRNIEARTVRRWGMQV